MTAVPIRAAETPQPSLTQLVMLAMSRARVEPFSRDDWAAYAGAQAPAYMVHMHAPDLCAVLKALEADHWPLEYVTVALDANGLSFMASSPVNAYAFSVDLELQRGAEPAGTPEAYWEVDKHYGGVEAAVAALPEPARGLLMACPYDARPYALKGYLSTVEPEKPAAPTHWLYQDETGLWVLRHRNPDSTAGMVELRHHSKDWIVAELPQHYKVAERAPPLTAFR